MIKQIEDLGQLAKDLDRSIRLRAYFNLDNEGTIKVLKIKPAGATMEEVHKHKVRIYKAGTLVDECSLSEYNSIFE